MLLACFVSHTSSPYIYTLSLHDALPILLLLVVGDRRLDRVLGQNRAVNLHRRKCELLRDMRVLDRQRLIERLTLDRKSTRLNSSHVEISYAVFCLKKKKYREIQLFHMVK